MASEDLERAIAVAARAFDGRVDRQGQPYVAHAIRVMLDVDTDDERAVAMLHDVFEWGTVTLRQFHAAKFPKRIVDAVDALTKRHGESTAEHVERVRGSELAATVKVADLRDNALEWRLDALDGATRDRLVAMYRETAQLLGTSLDEICGRPVS
ncbi:HD domain-containing protein [Agrococcus jenensis]|uniref:HD domain-containing protein n=1 Tax=Agrococcus jenensis TaxID=46353 RepID=A0A3N2AV09_9MICO|nr:HD domain-containing protein [Agrococcus jenensis]ROR66873.1 HD domain-containing protein [Agrococcus jenensis]